MSPRPYAAAFAIIALVTLGACGKKEPEPPASTKSVADETAKKTAATKTAATKTAARKTAAKKRTS